MMIKKHEDFDKAIGNQEVSHIVSQFTCIDVEVFQLITGKNIGFTFLPMLIERKRVKSYRSITLSFSQVRKHSSFTSILCQIFILKCRHQFFNSLILDYWQCFVCGFVLDPNSMAIEVRIRIRNADSDTQTAKEHQSTGRYVSIGSNQQTTVGFSKRHFLRFSGLKKIFLNTYMLINSQNQSWARDNFLTSRQRQRDNATTLFSLRDQSGTSQGPEKKSKNSQASVSRWGSNNKYSKMEITNNFMA